MHTKIEKSMLEAVLDAGLEPKYCIDESISFVNVVVENSTISIDRINKLEVLLDGIATVDSIYSETVNHIPYFVIRILAAKKPYKRKAEVKVY